MSEKKNDLNDENPNSEKSSGNDAELENLISSVMEKKKNTNGNLEKNDKFGVGEISDAVIDKSEISFEKINSGKKFSDEKNDESIAEKSKVIDNGNSAGPKKSKPVAKSNSGGKSAQKKSAGSAGNGSKSKKSTAGKPNAPVSAGDLKKASNKSSDADKKNSSKSNKKSSFKSKKAKWSKKKKVFFTLGIVFLLICLLALAAILLFDYYASMLGKYSGEDNSERPNYSDVDSTKEDTIDADEEEAKLKEQLSKTATNIMSDSDVFNVLLIGEDIRDTATEDRGNTDVMMMISINSKEKTLTMTSFMRDIYLYLPDWNYSNRLNAAYSHSGPEGLENTLEQYFGVNIDRYVLVNFYSFIEIVETVGGLEMTVSDAEAKGMNAPLAEQNKYLENKKGTDYLEKGGTDIHLNGNQSLAFSRLRYVGNADFERTERQRRVINEIIRKSKKLSLVQLDSLLTRVLPQVKTDLEKDEIASLLLNSFEYMNYDVQELRIPADGTFTDQYINGMSVLCPDFDANAKLLQDTIFGVQEVEDTEEDQFSY